MAILNSEPSVGNPDIAYLPDWEKYQARTKKRLATEKLDQSLPAGFPSKLKSDLVWDGESIQGQYEWVYELNADDLVEVEEALQHFKCNYC
jgi:hypothetical protein